MSDTDEKMALWIAFTLRVLSDDEVKTLIAALQTKRDELRKIIND